MLSSMEFLHWAWAAFCTGSNARENVVSTSSFLNNVSSRDTILITNYMQLQGRLKTGVFIVSGY